MAILRSISISIFTITNCVSATRLHIYHIELLEYFVVLRHQERCAEADRETVIRSDPQNTADPRKDCGSFVNEKLRALHRRNLNK